LQFLAFHGIPAWRMNSGAYKSQTGTFVRYGFAGCPDIIAIVPGTGKFLAIEVKSATGKLTDEQKAFARIVNESRAYAIVARSVEDVENFLKGVI